MDFLVTIFITKLFELFIESSKEEVQLIIQVVELKLQLSSELLRRKCEIVRSSAYLKSSELLQTGGEGILNKSKEEQDYDAALRNATDSRNTRRNITIKKNTLMAIR